MIRNNSGRLSRESLVALVASTVAVALGLYWYVWSSRFVTTDNAYVETDLSPVTSRMMGYVREVFVTESSEVKKGDHLLKLDDVDVRLELGFKQAKLKKAETDTSRAEKLASQRAVSAADLELAQATLAGIRADLEGSQLKLQFTDVVSPIDGVVAKRSAQPGQFVQPGQTLFVVVPKDRMWIIANYKENQIRLIKAGQKVEMHVDAYPGEVWTGKVDYVFPSSVASLSLMKPENSTGNFTKVVQRFPVRIVVEAKPDFPLSIGMSVEPTVIVK